MKNKVIFHGSHTQNLRYVNSAKSRFEEKIFGTFNFQRALTYLPSRENCGTGVLERKSRLYVLNIDANKLVDDNGSVYIIDAEGFKFDAHKGEKQTWIFSIEKEMKVLQEIKISNILFYWYFNNIFPVNPDSSEILMHDPSNQDLIDTIEEDTFKILN